MLFVLSHLIYLFKSLANCSNHLFYLLKRSYCLFPFIYSTYLKGLALSHSFILLKRSSCLSHSFILLIPIPLFYSLKRSSCLFLLLIPIQLFNWLKGLAVCSHHLFSLLKVLLFNPILYFTYLKGKSSSSLKLGLGPSPTDVLTELCWNITSTNGRTMVWKKEKEIKTIIIVWKTAAVIPQQNESIFEAYADSKIKVKKERTKSRKLETRFDWVSSYATL